MAQSKKPQDKIRRGTEHTSTAKKTKPAAPRPATDSDSAKTVPPKKAAVKKAVRPARASREKTPALPPRPDGAASATPVEDKQPPLPVRSGVDRPAAPARGRFGKATAIILAPSLLVVFLLVAFPGIRTGIFGGDSGPSVPPPTNLLPTEHDRVFLSPTLFLSNQIVAYYGHPLARWMGIVGRFSKEELGPMVKRTAERYNRLNGGKGTVPAFYLIYGTAQPGGNILTMDKSLIDPYIKYTANNGLLLILDHQIGKFGPKLALQRLLPFLKYPHVHLALDPEWRTTRPMQEIGSITAEEINEAQAIMSNYMVTNRIPGQRMLIVHQFEDKMLVRRDKIRSMKNPVLFVHSVSGWGAPSMKLATWGRHAKATNLATKAFKLWYDPGLRRPGLHFDWPLMPPQDVLALRPEPQLIIYQ